MSVGHGGGGRVAVGGRVGISHGYVEHGWRGGYARGGYIGPAYGGYDYGYGYDDGYYAPAVTVAPGYVRPYVHVAPRVVVRPGFRTGRRWR